MREANERGIRWERVIDPRELGSRVADQTRTPPEQVGKILQAYVEKAKARDPKAAERFAGGELEKIENPTLRRYMEELTWLKIAERALREDNGRPGDTSYVEGWGGY